MYPNHNDDRTPSEADRTTETRFGPRPVPPGHHGPKPSVEARRVIASGRMSPDGRSAYPSPALATRIVVWGGVALGVAGGTAAAVFALRKIADAISGDDRPAAGHASRRAMAPRFADMDAEDREAMRRRVREQDRVARQQVARLRAEASQRRETAAPHRPASARPQQSAAARRGNFVEDVIETSQRLSESLEGVAKSLLIAMEGFRSVAHQASEIVSEFADTADQLRAALRGDRPRHDAGATPEADGEGDAHDRTHRL